MRKPRASVIVITKNEEKFIEHCLVSLRHQTVKDIEVIVSDSKSTDGTVRIARRYADKVVVKKTNVSEGRNLGASHARGDILVFVDADTALLPDTLENVLRAFKNKKVVGATCPVLPMSADPKFIGVYVIYSNYARASCKLRKPHIAGLFCAYRRDTFEKVGGFDENVGTLEDFHLSMRIGKLGRVEFVDSTVVLTSHRRVKAWGLRIADKYTRAWIKLMATGKGYSFDWYNPIR